MAGIAGKADGTRTACPALLRDRQPRVGQLLGIGQLAQRLYPESGEERVGGDEGVGRAPAGFAGAGADQVTLRQPPDQVAADLSRCL